MGTYNVKTIEIAEVLDNALDDIEGDFTEKQLFDVLKHLKLYPFVSDKMKSVPNYLKSKRSLR